ncbi:hypothetical protein B0H13DRAFT_2547772 [Mycena leptocephala]|nr:hypothetical protein B0H13DRAFT_2547772 [Mycena leptocephala]
MSFGNGAHVSGGTWTHVAGNMNMTAVTSSNSALVAAPASQQPIVSARDPIQESERNTSNRQNALEASTLPALIPYDAMAAYPGDYADDIAGSWLKHRSPPKPRLLMLGGIAYHNSSSLAGALIASPPNPRFRRDNRPATATCRPFSFALLSGARSTPFPLVPIGNFRPPSPIIIPVKLQTWHHPDELQFIKAKPGTT